MRPIGQSRYGRRLYADFVLGAYYGPHQAAIISPHNIGDAGTRAINVAVRKALKLPQDRIVEGDLLLITVNNYRAPRSDDPEETETIYNGERAEVGRSLRSVLIRSTSSSREIQKALNGVSGS